MLAAQVYYQTEIEIHVNERISEFEEKLKFIAECREKEMSKPFTKRNNEVLYLLHKDEVLYNFCLSEFKKILTLI
jgi:hypothetical protein